MKKTQSHLTIAIFNAFAFIAVLIVNSLANIIPLGGMNTGQISDLYPNLFVPAGLTFSIWGLIYILLALYVVYNFIYKVQEKDSRENFMDKIGYLFFFSSLGNICWVLSWHYRKMLLSLISMLIILITLIYIYQVLVIGKSHISKKERFFVHLPFSVYLGWITVATIANMTALLVNMKWNGWGLSESFWTVAVIIVAILIGLLILLKRKDIAFVAVIDWALLGILIKRRSLEGADSSQIVVSAVVFGLILLSSGIIYQIVRNLFFKDRNVL